MARKANISGSDSVTITLSTESLRLLSELASRGIYGRNEAEVAGRFVDRALTEFVTRPTLGLRSTKRKAGQ